MSQRRNPARARLPLARRRHQRVLPHINTSEEYIVVRGVWYSEAHAAHQGLQSALTYTSWEWQDRGPHRTPWTATSWSATWGETADFALGQHWSQPCVWAYDGVAGHDSPIMIGGTRDVSMYARRRYQV